MLKKMFLKVHFYIFQQITKNMYASYLGHAVLKVTCIIGDISVLF